MVLTSTPKLNDYLPQPKQGLFHKLKHYGHCYAFFGGWRSGKSLCGCAETLIHCMNNANARALVGRATYADVSATTMEMFLEMCPDSIISDYNKTSHLITLRNGSTIRFVGFDRFRKFGSLNLSCVWIEEAADRVEERMFHALQGRLSLKHVDERKMFITSNNDSQSHWLFKNFIQGGMPHNVNPMIMIQPDTGFMSVQASTAENVDHLPPGYIDQVKKSVTPEMYSIYILGDWGTLEVGKCYYAYDPLKNGTNREFQQGLMTILTTDFNVNPMTALVIQEEHHNNGEITSYVVDEIVLNDSSTHKMCNEFLKRYRGLLSEVLLTGDATCQKRDTRSQTTDLKIITDTLTNAGISVVNRIPRNGANPSVRNSINVVNARLLAADNERRLFINPRKAPQTHIDLMEVSYKEGTRDIDKSNAQLTHASDALRYYIWSRFGEVSKARMGMI